MSTLFYESDAYDLNHHGVLGQKWGVRRYQNKDGSLTPRGKKHLAELESEYESLTGKKEAPTPRKKASDMSDEELRNAITRKKLEKEYAEYTKPKEAKKYFNGKQFISDIMNNQGKALVGDVAKYVAGKSINELFNDEVVKVGKEKKVTKRTSTTLPKGKRLSDLSDSQVQDMVNRFNNESTIKKYMNESKSSLDKMRSVNSTSELSDAEMQALIKRIGSEKVFDAYVKEVTSKKDDKDK